MENNKIKGFLVNQNGQDFIIGKAKIKEILSYTMYTERLIIGFDEDEIPIYNEHIQRKVEESRINKIADFLINDDTATFPTNIVLGIPANVIESQNVENDMLMITLKKCVEDDVRKAKQGDANAHVYITIIDGQHRIAGIERAVEKLTKIIDKSDNKEFYINKLNDLLNIELVISCFIDKSLEYEAMIFSTINRTQKRVSQDLVYSLFGLNENDTPYKSALEITLALNGHPKSPFYQRVKLYGANYDNSFIPPLSQSSMIKKIVSFISESFREAENDRYKKRTELNKQKGKKYLPFRSYYANGMDKCIADCLFYYFSSVRKYFPDLWEYDTQRNPTNVLQSTVGFDALMTLLKDILSEDRITIFDNNTFDKYVLKLKGLQMEDTIKFPMTTAGKKILYNSMFVKVFPAHPSVPEKIKEIESKREQ